MDETLRVTAHNRDAWNAIAPARGPRPAEFFAEGGTTFDDVEAEALGDLKGQRALHLQCANGNETLSLAVLGAEAVGVDISDVAVAIARENAEATGLPCAFTAADVYGLPDLGDFDLVYSSSGAVCWLPDLPAWAGIVASLLRPGGRFLLYEHHPLWEVLDTADTGLRIDDDYFGADRAEHGARPDDRRSAMGTTADSDFISFVWPVGNVVTALIGAGLRITGLTEQPEADMYPGLGERAAWLPATYLVQAVKPVN